MLHYTDDNRGMFQDESHAKQLISFQGMLYEGCDGKRNVTPTDIDGYIQLDNYDIFILFELKKFGPPSYGQGHAYAKMIDGLQDGGKNAVLIVAEHNTKDQVIMAKDAVVTFIYVDGKWHKIAKKFSLDEAIRRYIESVNKKRKTLCQE